MECPAVKQAMPDDSHHLGVLIPPTKRLRHRQGEGERDVKVGKAMTRLTSSNPVTDSVISIVFLRTLTNESSPQ